MTRAAQPQAEDDTAALSALQTVDSVVAIPLHLIEPGERLRPIDESFAAALGRIMTADGGYNRTPVEVCRLPGKTTFLLGPGGHRWRAAQLEGWETIRAVIVSPDVLQRRLAQVSENLFRSGLKPMERAAFVAELVELKKLEAGIPKDVKPQSIAAKARWSEVIEAEAEDASATVARAYGFSDAAAERLNLSRRTIYRDLELHRGLRPGVAARLHATEMAGNAGQLRALAKLPEAEQRKAVDLIVEGRAKDTTDALALLRPARKPEPADKHYNAFLGSWSRMGAREKRRALRELASLGLPKGVTLTFDGDSDA